MEWVLFIVLVAVALAALWWWRGRRSRGVGPVGPTASAQRTGAQPRDDVDMPLIPPIAPLPGGAGVAPVAPVPTPLLNDPDVAGGTGSPDPDEAPDDPVDRDRDPNP